MMETMRVTQRVDDGDRVLLYGERERYSVKDAADIIALLVRDNVNYHVIAAPDVTAKVGDTIEYEPFGVNFGWFKRVVEDGT